MIYLVHHHLRRGGVTRVMVKTAEILRDAGEDVCILSGEESPEPVPEGIRFQRIPGMGYHDPETPTDTVGLFKKLASLSKEGDLWHIHNHSLGKNPAVTDAWIRLAEAGHRVVFQPHDFAEDGRPANLRLLRESFPGFPNRLYPTGPNVRYAVLQERDRGVLASAGIPLEHIHVLPNPVATESFATPADPPRRLLYLTRAIRRKNIGEFLFWAKHLGEDLEFATSLLPENPAEKVIFDGWKAFAEAEGIRVTWGIGASGRSFREVVEWGDACITTSVGEGFGMSFLEPYAMGRSVVGRDLPGITAGFKADGVDLSHLYASLPVPVDAVDEGFWKRACAQVHQWSQAMGLENPPDEAHLRRAWVKEESLDFGRLDEPAQQFVLRKISDLPLQLPMSSPISSEANRSAIEEAYAPSCMLHRIRSLYGEVEETGTPTFADGTAVRDAFMNPESLFLLRT